MIASKYPILNSKKFIEVSISTVRKISEDIYECEWMIQ